MLGVSRCKMRHLQTKVGHLHTKGHGERHVGSLFRVDEPVPDDSFPGKKRQERRPEVAQLDYELSRPCGCAANNGTAVCLYQRLHCWASEIDYGISRWSIILSSYELRIPGSYVITIGCSYGIRTGCSYGTRIGCFNGIMLPYSYNTRLECCRVQ